MARSRSALQAGAVATAALLTLFVGVGDVAAQYLSDTDWAGADFTPANGATIAGNHTNIGLFHIPAGTTVFVEPWTGSTYGSVFIDATTILIEGDLVAIGAGFAGGLPTPGPSPNGTGLPGEGPGAGGGGTHGNYVGCSGGGGAGYGGAGGAGGDAELAPGPGGAPYGDSTSMMVVLGSGGGAGGSHGQPGFEAYLGGPGGAGGGAVTLNAGTLTITGAVLADGADGGVPAIPSSAGGGGAGSGGGILITAGSGVISGTLSVIGGVGGPAGTSYVNIGAGGGGGGGRIKVIGVIDTSIAMLTAVGGDHGLDGTSVTPPAEPGMDGSVYTFSPTIPVATVTPGSISFGDLLVGTSATPQTLTVDSTGTGPLTVNGITLGGSSMFSFVMAPPFPVTLMPGQSLSLSVAYDPTSQATHTGTITVDTNDAVNPVVMVPVSGNGVLPAFSVSPTLLDFGTVRVGMTSVTLMFDIENNGTAPANLTGATVGGASAEFSITGLPATPAPVAPGASMAVSVTYLPVDQGTDNATITLTSNDSMNPMVVVDLAGEGIDGVLMATPMSVDFGGWPLASLSPPTTVTLENTGSDDVEVSSAVLGGTNPAAFALASIPPLPFSLAPGASQSLDLTFTPGMVGSFSAYVTLSTDSSATPTVNVTLSGQGLAATLGVSPTNVDFGQVVVGTTSPPELLLLSNPSGLDVMVLSVALGGGSPGVFGHDAPPGGLLVPAGSTASLPVWFAPTAQGAVGAILSLTTDVPGVPAITVNLVGTGVLVATDGGTMMPGSDAGMMPMTGRGGCSCRVGAGRNAGTDLPRGQGLVVLLLGFVWSALRGHRSRVAARAESGV